MADDTFKPRDRSLAGQSFGRVAKQVKDDETDTREKR